MVLSTIFARVSLILKNRVAAIGRVLKVLFDWLVRCYCVIAN